MFRTPLVVVAAMAMIAFSPGTASASQDPVGDLLGQLQDTTTQVTTELTSQLPISKPPVSIPPLPTADPAPAHTAPPATRATADRTAAEPVDLSIAGQQLATAGGSGAAVNPDHSTAADSPLLTLGGQELLGAHADSTGQSSDHFGDFLAPLCDASDGLLCARILYADADATDNGATSQADSRSGLLDVCLGGASTEAGAPCAGPLHTQIVTSQSDADYDQPAGRTTGSTTTKVAGLCLQPDPTTGDCALDAAVLPSQGAMDSAAAQPVSGSSSLFSLAVAGTDLGSAANSLDPSALGECLAPELVCAATNQGETAGGSGEADHEQDGLTLAALPALQQGLLAGLGHTEAAVNSFDSTPSTGVDDPGSNAQAAGNDSADNAANTAKAVNASASTPSTGLPNTGGVWSALLGLGLLLLGVGVFVSLRGRKESRA